MQGQFIVFEGTDTAMLTEQANLLEKWLRAQGKTVLLTREPTNSPVGALAQQVLNGRLVVEPQTRAVLFLADRLDHVLGASGQTASAPGGILADLENGTVVIGVHYLLQALAQEDANFAWLCEINQPCPWPDLVIFIDTPVVPDAGSQEAFRQHYHQAIDHCRQSGQAVYVVNGSLPAEAIQHSCRTALQQLERGS